VFIAEENLIFQQSLLLVLRAERQLRVVGCARNDEEAAARILASRPDIALVSADLPRHGAAELARQLRRSAPTVRVIVMGINESASEIMESVESGAVAWIPNHASVDDLRQALRTVRRDGMICPPDVARSLFSRLADLANERAGHAGGVASGLTVRELQVLTGVGRGLTNKEIAANLHISSQTVKNHVHHVLEKLGAKNRVQALRFARDRHWLTE
jgi:two-component system, NarL family, nitrate/nitrite response regulator NarL